MQTGSFPNPEFSVLHLGLAVGELLLLESELWRLSSELRSYIAKFTSAPL